MLHRLKEDQIEPSRRKKLICSWLRAGRRLVASLCKVARMYCNERNALHELEWLSTSGCKFSERNTNAVEGFSRNSTANFCKIKKKEHQQSGQSSELYKVLLYKKLLKVVTIWNCIRECYNYFKTKNWFIKISIYIIKR